MEGIEIFPGAMAQDRRPVTITRFYLVQSDGRHAVLTPDVTAPYANYNDQIPKELHEGRTAKCILPAGAFADVEVKTFFVCDTVGRDWHSIEFPLRDQPEKKVGLSDIEGRV